MKPAPFNQKDHDQDEAKADCIKHGTPTMGVDHSNHYEKIELLIEIEPKKEKESWQSIERNQ